IDVVPPGPRHDHLLIHLHRGRGLEHRPAGVHRKLDSCVTILAEARIAPHTENLLLPLRGRRKPYVRKNRLTYLPQQRRRDAVIRHGGFHIRLHGRRFGGVTRALEGATDIQEETHRMVTSSSATVGWIATVSSKSFFVAPMRTATANPCIISSAPGPTTCTPTTRCSAPTVTSFMSQRGFRVSGA